MDALVDVLDAGEVFREAVPFVHPNLPDRLAAVELRFSESTVHIAVGAELDTLAVTSSAPEGLREKPPMTAQEPWASARGLRLLWAWRMTNQQGYDDGIQLAFTVPDAGVESVTIQLVGMASMIDVSIVQRVPLHL